MDFKKLRLYYWLVAAFFEKYLLHVAASFFVTSLVIVAYLYFSKDIIQILSTNTRVVGIAGKYSLDSLPPQIIADVTKPLLVQKPDGSYESEIVSEHKHNAEFTRFELTLHPDLFFTDGTPFRSSDVSFAFKDIRITYPTDTRVVFELSKSFPPFLTYLTQPVFSINPFKGIKGDYLISKVRYEPSNDRLSEITLTPLVDGKPKIVYKFYRSEIDLVTAYKLNEINEFTTTAKVAFDTFTKWPRTTVTKSGDFSKLVALFFNLDQLLLKEKDVRLALYGSLPIKDLESSGGIAVSPISPLSPYYDATIPRIAENPEVNKAILKRYLSQATDSAKFKLSTSFEFINLAHIVQQIIESAGGKVNVDVSGLSPGERSDLTLGLWDIPSDVNQYFLWHSSQKGKSNITGYSNQKVDKLLEEFRATDSASLQKEIMSDFQKEIVKDAPALFLYYPHIFTIRRGE